MLEEIYRSDCPNGRYGRIYHMLDVVAKGREYRVYSIPLTDSVDGPLSTPTEKVGLFEAIKDHLVVAVRKGENILVVLTPEKTSYLRWFHEIGMDVCRGKMPSKRVSQWIRPYQLFGAVPANAFRVKVFHGKRRAKTTDGAIVIGSELFEHLLDQSLARMQALGDREAYSDLCGLRTAKVFNGRLWLPNHGLVKGQFFVSDRVQGVITHASNIKKEILVGGTTAYFGLDHQPGKLVAYSNRQSIRNYPAIYGCGVGIKPQDTYLCQLAQEEIQRKLDNVTNGVLDDTLEELIADRAKGLLEDSEITNIRLRAVRWAEIGDIRCSKALLLNSTTVGMERIADSEELSIRVRIPGATYCQLVSADVMSLILGRRYKVQEGTCQFIQAYRLYVVSNTDFLRNLRNHGGMDNDDKLIQIFRKRGDKTVVFTHRNPSDRGEYAVYDFVGTPPVEVPDIQLPELPPQATEVDRVEGKPDPLPSESRPIDLPTGLWGYEDFLMDVTLSGSNPGSVINAITLWNTSNSRGNRNPFLPQMESIVDTMVQTRVAKDISDIQQRTDVMLHNLVYKTKLPVDRTLLKKCRYFFGKKYPEVVETLEEQGRLGDSWYTKLVNHVAQLVAQGLKDARVLVDRVAIQLDYRAILPESIDKSLVTVVRDRYLKCCSLYAKCPSRTPKGSISSEGHAWISQGVQEQIEFLVQYFSGKGINNPWHKVMILLAYVGSHTDNRTDHILTRKEMFDTYLKVFAKMQGK